MSSENRFEAPMPSAVKKQLEKGEQIRQALNKSDTAPPAAAVPPGDPPKIPDAPVAAPEAPKAPAPLPDKGQEQQPKPNAPEPVPTPQQPQSTDELARLRQENQQLTAKYNTLQSKYDAEVPRLHSQVRDMEGKLQAAEQQNQELQKSVEQAQAAGEDALKWFSETVSPEYAENLSNFVASQVQPIQKRVQGVADEFQGVRKQSAQQTQTIMWDKIAETHPDWEAVNNEWKPWLLNKMGPTFEESYDSALQRALANNNATTVINILSEYKQQKAAGGGQHQDNGAGQIVLPDSSGGGGNPSPEKRKYRQSEIKAFYTEKSKLDRNLSCMYTREQAAALEADIVAAGREGRTLPG